jgi:oxygen-independent coproporphyrinogen-3 oxidase
VSAGVYLHIPFCKSRCSYCDFATDVYRSSGAVGRYVNALVQEINRWPPKCGTPNIDTIYFGGGTPSLLEPDQLEQILEAVHGKFSVSPDSEITMEMNPATVSPESLQAYKSLGINRASFGVQTFNDRALRLLARGHDANDARATFAMLCDAGFGNISFDLIAGLPGQTLDDWERNLGEAITLSPEHISLYLLEVHEGTPLAEQIHSGRQPEPDEDLAADMYRMLQHKLSSAGYEQYEISNFARPDYRSRHNTKYWQLEPVYGFGVSAHSFDGRERYANERDTQRYVDLIERKGSAEVMREIIDAASEYIFLGLRLNKGVNLEEYREKFGISLQEKYDSELNELEALGFVAKSKQQLCLTLEGMLYSNEVFARFV